MGEITVTAKKFQHLFDYLKRIGVDADSVASAVDLRMDRIEALDEEYLLPARHYARLYKEAVVRMQQVKQWIPWAAGLGGEAFELMCHCMVGARTLRDALRLAERFDALLYPVQGYRMNLFEEPAGNTVKLIYTIEEPQVGEVLVPEDWDRASSGVAAARSSGLMVWHALCGWLVGQELTPVALYIDAPFVSREYQDGLARTVNGTVHFDAGENTFSFDREFLDRRIVHTTESLQDFIKNSVYYLLAVDKERASTSAAIKSLVSIDLPNGAPSFAQAAEMLYMSESSLRRRLQAEKTTYQAIKDEVRCQMAIDMLLYEDAHVTDLAKSLGFSEPSSFVRSFKSWTGFTPKTYRDRMQDLGRSQRS